MRVVAIVGTKPFPRMIRALAELRRERADLTIWAQHAGGGLPEGLEGAPFENRARILDRMRDADAVVCHGGSGSVRDAISAGQVPVVIPRLARWNELVNDHQMEIAEAFAESIVFVTETDPGTVLAAIEAARARRGERRSAGAGPGPLAKEVARIVAAIRPARRAGVVWRILRVLTFWVPVNECPQQGE